MSQPGIYKFVLDGRSPDDKNSTVQFGVRTETFKRFVKRGLVSSLAQFYGIIKPDLCSARHLFRGLKRPLAVGDDMEADKSVLVYTWDPPSDWYWSGGRFDGTPTAVPAGPAKVFAVLIREENVAGVVGSIEHWNWLRESPQLPGAPVDWERRYGSKIWSRE